jgi:hypothetical protein
MKPNTISAPATAAIVAMIANWILISLLRRIC